jgi:Coenzyme PQQ synthesis protein D (PqqD)
MSKQANPLKPQRIEAFTREFGDELLVYDQRRHRAHCLNKTAAAVWLECDGEATVAEIAKRLESLMCAECDDVLVRLAVAKLRKAGLLEKSDAVADSASFLHRRDALKRLRTVALMALPVVTTMLVPTPAFAASCFPLLHACNNNLQCCSGHCGISGVSTVCLP